MFEESWDELDGRQLSVLEHIPGIAAMDAASQGALRRIGLLVADGCGDAFDDRGGLAGPARSTGVVFGEWSTVDPLIGAD